MTGLVDALEQASPLFRDLWHRHDVHGRCYGSRTFVVEGVGPVAFQHSTLIVDEEKHLRLALYAALADDEVSRRFEAVVSTTLPRH